MSAIDLAYSEYNENATTSEEPPIVITHCFMGNRKTWDKAASYLARKTGRIVYCLDLRDHGESANMTDSHLKDYVSDIERFLLKKNLLSCDFIGHSYGGKFLLMLAFEKPHFFQSLILVDILPNQTPKIFDSYLLFTLRKLDDILKDLNETGSNLPEAINICDRELAKNSIEPASFREMLTDSLKLVNGRYELAFNSNQFTRRSQRYIDFDTQGKVFSGPILIVAIEKSLFVTPVGLKETAKIIPNRSVVVIPNSSHNIPMEKPRELVDECVKFWSTLKR